MIPGEIITAIEPARLRANLGLKNCTIRVVHMGDRPVQVGSHFHFHEVNEALQFDRELAWGMRLDIPAGTAVRFEPGDDKEVELVSMAGQREVFGLNNKVNGKLDK